VLSSSLAILLSPLLLQGARESSILNPVQIVSLFLGIAILLHTVVRMRTRRTRVIPDGLGHEPLPASAWATPPAARTGGARGGSRGGEAVQTQELERLLVDLQETGREIEARLDTKIRYAQRLIEEAQRTLTDLDVARARAEGLARTAPHRAELAEAESVLQRVEEQNRVQTRERFEQERRARAGEGGKPKSMFAPIEEDAAEEGAGNPGVAGEAGGPVAPPEPPDSSERDPGGIAPGGTVVGTEGPSARASTSRSTEETAATTPPPPRKRPPIEEDPAASQEAESQGRIRELAAEGRSAPEIAREVNRPVGEIELILALGRTDSVSSG
jgi:hypothetical protein